MSEPRWERLKPVGPNGSGGKPTSSLKRMRDVLSEADAEIEELTRKYEAEKKKSEKLSSDLEAERASHKRTRSGHAEALREATDLVRAHKTKQEEETKRERDARISAETDLKKHRSLLASSSPLDAVAMEIRSDLARLSAEIAELRASGTKVPAIRESASVPRAKRSYKFSFERGRDGRIASATATPHDSSKEHN